MTPPRPKTREVAEELARTIAYGLALESGRYEALVTGIRDAIIAAEARGHAAGRAEALEEAAKVAESSDYPLDRLYTNGRKAAADAIRALATKEHA